ncbi:MAG: DNA polymerase I, partial [Oscillibacter sp.]
SIDALYAKMPEIDAKPAALRRLQEGEASARNSHYLATIVTDVPMDFDPGDNRVQSPAPEAYSLFLRLEFTKLLERFGLTAASGQQPASGQQAAAGVAEESHSGDAAAKPAVLPAIVTEQAAADALLALWRGADHVAVQVLPDLTGVAVYCETAPPAARMSELFFERYAGNWNAFLQALFGEEIRKISHNVKDLMRLLLENGLPAEGFVFDTALGAYLLDATAGNYDLPRLFVAYYNVELPKPAHLHGDAFSLLGDGAAAEASLASYTAAIAALYDTFAEKLKAQNQWELYHTAELPLCRVLAEMEQTGCRVDGKALTAFSALLSRRIGELESSIYQQAGEEFNINSPKQLGEILFERLGL